MPKKTGSAFDALLDTFGTDDDRELFKQLSERNPAIQEFGLRQDDYSRKLDANRAELTELQSWRQWREANWDSDHQMTRAERAKQERLEALETEKAELETKLASTDLGDGMTFEEVERIAQEAVRKQGIDPAKFLSADALNKKEGEVMGYVTRLNAVTAQASLLVPYLNEQHKDEFGTRFDPEEFVKAANERGTTDLRAFYKEYTQDERTKRIQTDANAKVKAAQDERDRAIAEERERTATVQARLAGMGTQGGNPADTDSPQMGALQRRMMKLDNPDKGDNGSGAPEVPLGEGAIAAHAAREFANRVAGR